MAVIVDKDKNGKPILSSVIGVGISEAEISRAVTLDKIIQSKIDKFTKKLISEGNMPDKGSKNKTEVYWEFGKILRQIFYNSGYIEGYELHLFWLNVKLHAPEGLLAKDRGPNRIHVAYCFRLAGYPKGKATRRHWSEWVYLFDSPSINIEERFDKWDREKLLPKPDFKKREYIRLFVQTVNALLRNIETNDLNDSELFRCYQVAKVLTKEIILIYGSDKTAVSKIPKLIKRFHQKVGDIIEDKIEIKKFVKTILDALKTSSN